MKRHTLIFAVIISAMMVLGACSIVPAPPRYEKYSYEFFNTFDTVIQFMGYSESEGKFDEMAKKGQARFEELSRMYDIYNDYPGINNIKTINDNAGIKPVEVKKEIIDLLAFSRNGYEKTGGTFNIALGPVLSIWHDYREEGKNNPERARLPDIELLRKASEKTDIKKVSINTSNSTVFLELEGMSLDVGAVAKGYACELVANELEASGYSSFIISAGGNVRTVGAPMDGLRAKWSIGIQNPDENAYIPDNPSLDLVYMKDASLVTSGDYQRYYTVDGKRIHHLIDPQTLMPVNYYRSVTILAQNSGLADILSTAAYLLPYEKSCALIDGLQGVGALWIMPDGSMRATENMKSSLKYLGGATNNK